MPYYLWVMGLSTKYIVLIFIAGIGIGFIARKPTLPSPAPSCEDHQCDDKLNALRDKFEKISEEDIAEYIHLKDMKMKYEKADEIFGKILNIFLLDLGLRVTKKQLADLKVAPPPVDLSTLIPLPRESSTQVRQPTLPASFANKQKSYLSTRNIESEEGVKKLLDENAFDNPLSSWGSGKPLDRRHFNLVRGRFVGQITFFDKDRTPWDVEMELTNANFEKGRVTAEFLLKTVDPSNPKHRDITTGDAGSTIRNFRSSDDGAILVEAMGADGVFQLYYFPQFNSLQGNVYEKRGLEEFKRTGTIVLNRR